MLIIPILSIVILKILVFFYIKGSYFLKMKTLKETLKSVKREEEH